jgi:hypothetical protein
MEITPVSIEQKDVWAQSQSGRFGGKKNLLAIPGI